MRDYCQYCGRKNVHDNNCPIVHPDKSAARAIYYTGWIHGRQGKIANSKLILNPTYAMGYGNGVVALESYENA